MMDFALKRIPDLIHESQSAQYLAEIACLTAK